MSVGANCSRQYIPQKQKRNFLRWIVSKQSDKHNINNRIDQRYESDEDESTQETG